MIKTETETETGLSLVEIGKNDPYLHIENQCCKSIHEGKKGIFISGDKVIIRPDAYSPSLDFASISLSGFEFLNFIDQQKIHILTESDENSSELPSIGQRLPSKDRAQNILSAWGDPSWVPDRKLEVIRLFIFNTRITKYGITLTPESRVVAIDGAGRLHAAYQALNMIYRTDSLTVRDHVVCLRNIVFQINIDLSANLEKAVQEFLLHNRDAKRTSSGTNLCAENTLRGLLMSCDVY